MNVREAHSSEAAPHRLAARRDREEAREVVGDVAGVFAALIAALRQGGVQLPPAPSQPVEMSAGAAAARPAAEQTAHPAVALNAAEPLASPPTAAQDALAGRYDATAPPQVAPQPQAFAAAAGAGATASSRQTLPAEAERLSRGLSAAPAPGEPELFATEVQDVPHLGDPSRGVSSVAAELASRRFAASRAEAAPVSLLSLVRECVREGRHAPSNDSEPPAAGDRQAPSPDNPPGAEQAQSAHPQPPPHAGDRGAAGWDAEEPLRGAPLSALLREAAELRPRESRTLRLRLNPEELGEVSIELTRAPDGTISARLDAETAAAERALSDNLAHLRSAMQLAGLEVGQLDVGGRDAGHGGGRAPHASPAEGAPAPGEAPADERRETLTGRAAADRLLTLHA